MYLILVASIQYIREWIAVVRSESQRMGSLEFLNLSR